MTDRDRVLKLLRARGETGVTPLDWARTPTADGGKPMLRLAARVQELRVLGYGIRTERLKSGVAKYVLDDADDPHDHLFQMPAEPHKPAGPYDLDDAA